MDLSRGLGDVYKRQVFLLAHNQQITYGYAGVNSEQPMYCEFGPGSVVIDPWRTYSTKNSNIKVIHYGNTRKV
jgi:hypothetical protein